MQLSYSNKHGVVPLIHNMLRELPNSMLNGALLALEQIVYELNEAMLAVMIQLHCRVKYPTSQVACCAGSPAPKAAPVYDMRCALMNLSLPVEPLALQLLQ